MDMLRGMMRGAVGFFRRQRKPFKVNIAKNLIQNFSLGLTQQYQSIYITELGAGPLELGYVNSIGGIAATALTLPAGWIADRFGIRRLLLSTILLYAIGYSIFGLAGSWQETILAYTLTIIAMCIGLVVCPMICGNTLRDEERVTGMQLCDTLASFPRIAAPIVAAFLITRFGGINVQGMKPLFWMEVAGILAAFAIIYFFFEDPLKGTQKKRYNPLSGLTRIFEEGVAVKRWLLYRTITSFPHYMMIFVPLYVRVLKGADQFTLGLMDMAYWLVIVLLALPVGLTADRFGRKRLITLMTPLYSLSMFLLVYASNNILLMLAGLLSGFTMLVGVTGGAINAELVPRELLGSWLGLNGLCRGIVNIVSPVLGGVLWESLGPEYVFYFLAVSQAASLLILKTVPKSKTRG